MLTISRTNFKKRPPDILIYLLIFLVAVVSRLPQLLSPLFYLDGDEAVVGLMAKHIIEGKDFSAYFYGQHYGFTLLESMPLALCFKVFGVSLYVMKLAMLGMWCIGLLFIFKAMERIKGFWAACLALCFMLTIPAWASWAMKARGGYITAFLFSAWVIYLCVKEYQASGNNWKRYLSIGIFLSIIFASQSLWLPGLIPWIAWLIYKKKDWRHLGYLLAGFAFVFIAIKWLGSLHANSNYWSPDFLGNYIVDSYNKIKFRVYNTLHGTYTVFLNYQIGHNTDQAAKAWRLAALLFLLLQCLRVIVGRASIYGLLFAASMVLTMSYTLFLNPFFYNDRHLLPLVMLIVAGVCLELSFLKSASILIKALKCCIVAILLWFSIASLVEFKNMDEEKEASLPQGHSRLGEMQQIVKSLKDAKTQYVFAMGAMTQYQLALLSNEEIIPRSYDINDRYPPYAMAVDKAYLDGKNTALLGNRYEMFDIVKPKLSSIQSGTIVYLGNGLYIYPNPDKALLLQLGFQFP